MLNQNCYALRGGGKPFSAFFHRARFGYNPVVQNHKSLYSRSAMTSY